MMYMLKRITIEDDEEYLRQVSSEIDFAEDDYMKYIECLEEYCKKSELWMNPPRL